MDERFPGGAEPEAPPPYLGGGVAGGGQMSDRMQSMLARAAEEQMAEQRQLQVLVNDVRSSLAQLQQDVRQNAAVEVLRGEVGAVGAEMRTGTTAIGERLEAVVRAVTASVQAVQSVGAQLETIHHQMSDQHAVLSTLPATIQRSVSDAIPPVDNAVPAEVAALRAELTAMRAEVAQLRAASAEVVRAEVARLREESEASAARISAHVDEAVLALAEAMLRRRPGSAAGTPSAPAPPAPVVETPAPATDTAGEDEPVAQVPDVEVPDVEVPDVEVPDVEEQPSAVDATGPADQTAEPAEPAEDSWSAGVTSAAAPRLAPPPPPPPPAQAPAPADEPADEAQAEVSGDDLGHEPAPEDDVDEVPGLEPAAAVPAVEPDQRSAEPAEPEAQPGTVGDPLDAGIEDAADAETGQSWADDAPTAGETPEPRSADEGGTTAGSEESGPEDRSTWFGSYDLPESAFKLRHGWDRGPKRPEPEQVEEAQDDESAADRERRRPWWRPGG